MLATSGADAAFEFRFGEIFIAFYNPVRYSLFGSDDDASSIGQAKPVAIGIAIDVRDIVVQLLAYHRLRDTSLNRTVETADVCNKQQIGRAVAAFVLKTFQ